RTRYRDACRLYDATADARGVLCRDVDPEPAAQRADLRISARTPYSSAAQRRRQMEHREVAVALKRQRCAQRGCDVQLSATTVRADPVSPSARASLSPLSTAIGKSASSRETGTSTPPSSLQPVSTSRQLPAGRARLVMPQSAAPSRYSR